MVAAATTIGGEGDSSVVGSYAISSGRLLSQVAVATPWRQRAKPTPLQRVHLISATTDDRVDDVPEIWAVSRNELFASGTKGNDSDSD